jgi:DNA-binding CsgD family transcriptional regulator
MTGFQALTEKEKESLRLLVDGHDAKSMARHLGLSVHTINERLRDARRKMSASSSREAARQLREIEAQFPENLGDKALGEATGRPDVEQLARSAEAPRMVRPSGWIAGAIIMSFSFALLAFASMSGSADTPARAPAAAPAESAAVAAARSWLALVEKGDWNGSWAATGASFKALNTVETWTRVAQQVQLPLGAVKSRVLVTEESVPAPPYGYQLVKFRTDYANKAGAIETLSLVREGGAWRVVGVTIE